MKGHEEHTTPHSTTHASNTPANLLWPSLKLHLFKVTLAIVLFKNKRCWTSRHRDGPLLLPRSRHLLAAPAAAGATASTAAAAATRAAAPPCSRAPPPRKASPKSPTKSAPLPHQLQAQRAQWRRRRLVEGQLPTAASARAATAATAPVGHRSRQQGPGPSIEACALPVHVLQLDMCYWSEIGI